MTTPTSSQLWGADLGRASISGADLNYADLSGANLSQANLARTVCRMPVPERVLGDLAEPASANVSY